MKLAAAAGGGLFLGFNWADTTAAPVVVDANKIAAGSVKNRAGEVVREPVEGGLVREDGRVVYPVREGIPIMLIDEAIAL